MKKIFLSTFVVALFAAGFIASSESSESDEVKYYNGEKLHKEHVKCAECGNPLWYWKSESSSLTISKPNTWNGEFYCGTCYSFKKDMEGVAREAAKKFQGL